MLVSAAEEWLLVVIGQVIERCLKHAVGEWALVNLWVQGTMR